MSKLKQTTEEHFDEIREAEGQDLFSPQVEDESRTYWLDREGEPVAMRSHSWDKGYTYYVRAFFDTEAQREAYLHMWGEAPEETVRSHRASKDRQLHKAHQLTRVLHRLWQQGEIEAYGPACLNGWTIEAHVEETNGDRGAWKGALLESVADRHFPGWRDLPTHKVPAEERSKRQPARQKATSAHTGIQHDPNAALPY